MKIIKKILIAIGIIILILIVAVIILLWIVSKQPAVKDNYYELTETSLPLEAKYTALGQYEVSYAEFEAENETYKKYEVWYPTEMETSDNAYPLVVMANGTGVPASKYPAVFRHLASWDFIVVGNDDGSSFNGESSAKCLDYLMKLNKDSNSIFYQHIDTENIGVAGHSQGGVGAINAVTAQENGNLYKAMYTASTTHIELADGLGWHFDIEKVKIPYFMVAGTLAADAGNTEEDPNVVGIAPLWSLQQNFDAIDSDITKVLARRVNTDHGDMLPKADGYMTAWFIYWLKGDKEAGKVFFGENAEILTNTNWQDVKTNP